jgi:hypothetical protein
MHRLHVAQFQYADSLSGFPSFSFAVSMAIIVWHPCNDNVNCWWSCRVPDTRQFATAGKHTQPWHARVHRRDVVFHQLPVVCHVLPSVDESLHAASHMFRPASSGACIYVPPETVASLTKSSRRWMPGVFLTSSGLFDLDMPPSYSACFTLCTGQFGCAVTL